MIIVKPMVIKQEGRKKISLRNTNNNTKSKLIKWLLTYKNSNHMKIKWTTIPKGAMYRFNNKELL